MTDIEFYSATHKSEFTIISQGFLKKIQRTQKYLSHNIGQTKTYHSLIQNLDSLRASALSYQLKVAIVGRQENLLSKVKLVNQNSETLKYIAQFTIINLPCNPIRIVRDYNLVFLVINSDKNSIIPERKIALQSQSKGSIVIVIDFNNLQNNISSWLENENFNKYNYFKLSQNSSPENQLSLLEQQYDSFLKPLVNQVIPSIEVVFEDKLTKIVNKHFVQQKSQYWEEIKQQKQDYFLGETIEQFQEKTRKLPQKLNKILQTHFKIIRQSLQESKQELTNPFVPNSFIYNVQQIINQATIIESRENKDISLNLVVSESLPRQTIHSHILELYQQRIDLWIEQQWQTLDQELNLVHQLQAISDREFRILHNLSGTKFDLEAIPQPVFDLNKYICPTTVSEISRMVFDYHYSQSSWFRIVIAIAAGAVFFLLTNRLFGFIFLVIQIINLITGHSPKSLKLKQQSKELRKYVDNKYQILIKFIADKLIQDISFFLDQQHQLYQEQINAYIQNSESNLESIKQKIKLNQNKLSKLNKEQEMLRQIIKD